MVTLIISLNGNIDHMVTLIISLNASYIVLYNEKNYGKGYCIRKGIEKSNGEITLIQDADLEYDPNDYSRLIDPIINNQADVVYGSRFIGGDKKRVLFFSVNIFFVNIINI